MEAVRLLRLGAQHWLKTQAIYHALGELMTEEETDTIILTRPQEAYLCVGYHQSLMAVLNRDVCRELGLPVIRRRVGGGTTYLDHDQQFYQCIFHHKRMPYRIDAVYQQLLGGPITALRREGIPAELRGGNEIEVGGRRIAGIGGGRIGEALVVVGNILTAFDYQRMAQVWNTPSETFRQFAYEAMQQHMTTIADEMESPLTPQEWEERIPSAYEEVLQRPVKPGILTDEEQEKAQEWEERLCSEEWLRLHSEDHHDPMTKLKISLGVFIHAEQTEREGRLLRATFHTREGVIQRAKLHSEGDNPAKFSIHEDALINTPLVEWKERISTLIPHW